MVTYIEVSDRDRDNTLAGRAEFRLNPPTRAGNSNGRVY